MQSPDSVVLSDDLYEGKPAILFSKNINGRTTIVSYVSDKHHDLSLVTMYSGKIKGNLAATADVQASAFTSKTRIGTVPNVNISQNDGKSNGPTFSLKDVSDFSVSKLEAENKKLTEAVNLLKEQFKLTQGHKVSDKALQQLSRRILRDYKSGYSADTLVENLRTMFDYLANAEQPAWNEVSQMGVSMARAIIELSSEIDKETYGANTYKAVRAFQKARGLQVDGVVGEETAKALGLNWKG